MDLKIRKLVPEDYKTLAVLANNKNIWNKLRDHMPHPFAESDAHNFIASKKDQKEDYVFAMDWNGDLVGMIGLHPQNDIYKLSAELGYWVGEPYWGRGFASEAVRQVLDFAFRQNLYLRIFAGVLDGNQASMKVLKKNGFQFEGISKKAVIKNNVILDEHRYAIIDENFELK